MAEYDPPLVHLPGTVLTPEVVLHRTLNKVHRTVSYALVPLQWQAFRPRLGRLGPSSTQEQDKWKA